MISFKCNKNVGNFLVRSTFKTIEKPGIFKCACSRCKTCPFVQNADKISGPKRSVKITDHFTCTSANVYLLYNLHIMQKAIHWRNRKTIRRDVEKDDKDASKPVALHLISLTILKNTCLFAAFPYIRVPQTAAKIWSKD